MIAVFRTDVHSDCVHSDCAFARKTAIIRSAATLGRPATRFARFVGLVGPAASANRRSSSLAPHPASAQPANRRPGRALYPPPAPSPRQHPAGEPPSGPRPLPPRRRPFGDPAAIGLCRPGADTIAPP